MDTVTLGKTNLQVSPIAFGTWQLGGEWGKFDEQKAMDAIRHAYSLGVNFFDTAQAYGFGVSERMLGQALSANLKRNRDEIVIATKGGLRIDETEGFVRDSSPEWLRRGVDESLTALGVDFIDLYQVHWPDSKVPFAETAQALSELVKTGKIRHVGVSNFDAAQMEEFDRVCPVETLQPPYNLFRREIEQEVLPYTTEKNIGVLVYGPLAHGLLTGTLNEQSQFEYDWRTKSSYFQGGFFRKNLAIVAELECFAREELKCSVAQLAIAWTLANPAVEVAIVGARSPKNIEDSLKAANVQLTADHIEQIEKIMTGSVEVLSPSPERIP